MATKKTSKTTKAPTKTRAKAPKISAGKTVAISQRFYYFLIIVIILLSLLSLPSLMSPFFRNAPMITGRSELTNWTQQQVQKLPTKYCSEIKSVMRESYQETALAIQNKEIETTPDARLRLSQLIQAKLLSLNRLSKNPQELETITQAMKPISDAIGDRLSSDVDAGKMRDNLRDVQKAFTEIGEGLK